MNPSELEKRLLEAFSEEAEERLESLFSRLNDLENIEGEDNRRDILEIVFREAHSLKGAARSVNLMPIEGLCQSMENVFGRVKAGELSFTPRMFDALHGAAEAVERYIAADITVRPAVAEEMAVLGKKIESLAVAGIPAAGTDFADDEAAPFLTADPPSPLPEEDLFPGVVEPAGCDSDLQRRPLFSDTIRISAKKLDSLLLKAEEMIVVKQISLQFLNRLKGIRDSLESPQKDYERLKEQLSAFPHGAGEFENGGLIESMRRLMENQQRTAHSMKDLIKTAEQGNRTVINMVDDLLNDMKKTTLQPFSTLFAGLPRMIREISKDCGKFIVLHLTGGEIEVDKRILERIKDPVLHLVRNAIDHGIESPEIRKSRRKPEKGNLRIDVSPLEGNRVELTIEDDGSGFDLAAIQSKALKHGIITEKQLESMTEAETISLIFQSGLSTSPLITEISGRGLGMAIVKDTVESLGGKLGVDHRPGHGSTFRLRLPITQATFRGILVSAGGHPFIIPDSQVQHVIRIRPEDVRRLENKPVIELDGCAIGLVHLHSVLGLTRPESSARKSEITAVIIGTDLKKTAFIVDEIINEQEVLVKNLGKQIGRIHLVAGATVLGSGQVVPVLNVVELNAATAGTDYSPAALETISVTSPPEKRPILVVEDSFTSRTLLKNILEASGYAVKTAINGEEGFALLQSETFHAVVSDVEMPRLNGFELTEKIRADQTLAEIPVILVTSLDSRRDRERGIDAGADAYIVKSSFDQSNLLEVLEQLI